MYMLEGIYEVSIKLKLPFSFVILCFQRQSFRFLIKLPLLGQNWLTYYRVENIYHIQFVKLKLSQYQNWQTTIFIAPVCSRVRYRHPPFRPSICQHLCRSSTFMSKLVFQSTTRPNNQQILHETSSWPPDFATYVSAFPFVHPFVCPSVNIYVEVRHLCRS